MAYRPKYGRNIVGIKLGWRKFVDTCRPACGLDIDWILEKLKYSGSMALRPKYGGNIVETWLEDIC